MGCCYGKKKLSLTSICSLSGADGARFNLMHLLQFAPAASKGKVIEHPGQLPILSQLRRSKGPTQIWRVVSIDIAVKHKFMYCQEPGRILYQADTPFINQLHPVFRYELICKVLVIKHLESSMMFLLSSKLFVTHHHPARRPPRTQLRLGAKRKRRLTLQKRLNHLWPVRHLQSAYWYIFTHLRA